MRMFTTTISCLGFLLLAAGSGSTQVTRSTVQELNAAELLRLYAAGAGRAVTDEYRIVSSELGRRLRSGTSEEHREPEAAICPLLERFEPIPVEQNPEISGLLHTAFRLAEQRPGFGNQLLNITTGWFDDPEDPRLSIFLLVMDNSPEAMHPALMNQVAALIRRSDLEAWTMQVSVSAMGGFGPSGLQRLRAMESDESVPDATVRRIRYDLSNSGGSPRQAKGDTPASMGE